MMHQTRINSDDMRVSGTTLCKLLRPTAVGYSRPLERIAMRGPVCSGSFPNGGSGRVLEDRRILMILNGRGERIRTSDPLVPNQIQPLIESC